MYAAALSYGCISDIKSLKIPNAVSVIVLALFFLNWWPSAPADGFTKHLIVAGVALLLGFGVFAAGFMGAGDIKLISALMLWAGPQDGFAFLIVMTLVGGLCARLLLITRKSMAVWPSAATLHTVETPQNVGSARNLSLRHRDLHSRAALDARRFLPPHLKIAQSWQNAKPSSGSIIKRVRALVRARRSSIKSAGSSIPIESRTSPQPMPSSARRSAGRDPWLIVSGCPARLSTPPRLSASVKSLSDSSKRLTPFSSASISIVTMPPKPFICRAASACCGWLSRPG